MLGGMHLLASAAVGSYSGTAFWYATRGTGAVALVLLSAVVVLGVLGPLRLSSVRWPRFALATLHRDLSLLAIVFVAIHVTTTVLDGFAPISFAAGIIPFQSPYRTFWLGLGTVAFDLMLALVITSLIRLRLGHRRWRKIHWLAYASWPIAAFHGLGTGTDASQPWLLLLTAACGTAILIAALVRIRERWAAGVDARAWLALALTIPVALFAFALAGPLSPNWAKRAGTPTLVFGHAAPVSASTSGATPAPATTATPGSSSGEGAEGASPTGEGDESEAPAGGESGAPAGGESEAPSGGESEAQAAGQSATATQPFSAHLVGRVVQSSGPNGAIIDMHLKLEDGPPSERGGTLLIRLAGRPLPGGGVALVGSEVDLNSSGTSELTGSLTSLDGTNMTAQVLGATGAKLTLNANLSIDQQTGSVSGQLSASPVSA